MAVLKTIAQDEVLLDRISPVLPTLVLALAIFLMVNLHRYTSHTLRSYQYLGELEEELRRLLGLQPGTIAFTREGDFYWGRRTWAFGLTKWVYTVLLTLFLLANFGRQIFSSFQMGNPALIVLDVALSLLYFVYVVAYVRVTLRLDRDADETPQPVAQKPV